MYIYFRLLSNEARIKFPSSGALDDWPPYLSLLLQLLLLALYWTTYEGAEYKIRYTLYGAPWETRRCANRNPTQS